MMYRRMFALMMVLILCALPLGAGAEGFTLPDLGGSGAGEDFVLPNPGSHYGKGTLSMKDYDAGGGRICDVYLYPHNSGWKDAVNPWISECKAAGFEWTYTTINDKPAYVVSANGLSAVLVPDYDDNAMLMLQHGLTMGPDGETPAEELRLGQVRITGNGHVDTITLSDIYAQTDKMSYDYYGKTYYCYLFTDTIYGLVTIDVSDLYGTGDTITQKKNHWTQGFRLNTNEGTKNYLDTRFIQGSDRITSASDHCDITIICKDEKEVWCKMDGVYMDGTEELCVEFRLKLDYHS